MSDEQVAARAALAAIEQQIRDLYASLPDAGWLRPVDALHTTPALLIPVADLPPGTVISLTITVGATPAPAPQEPEPPAPAPAPRYLGRRQE